MVKTKNANKGKQVARSETLLVKFILVQAVANYEDWTQEKRKIAPGHQFNLLYRLVNKKNIAFDDKLLNSILETPKDKIEKRFEEIFTKGIVLKRSEDRTVEKLDAYRRILHHIISNIVIPNVGHKSSITNMHSFAMLALHEHGKMNFGHFAIEHMLATQSSSTKYLPYGCFLTKVFQHFNIPLFGPNDQIGIEAGILKNEEGKLMRGGQEEDSENSEEEEEEEGNEPEECDSETEVERIRRETRRKKRQERIEEGKSSVDMAQIMDRIAAMQAQLNHQPDDIN
ncbi:hypothetical protein M9H77_23885 [Catharanthus roseus]|uniref:Uncharacterized protein n=1 Tax=Catharanthus roseus TaxID=4058 RepID=A0ACC0AX30_CATRO|nr:hypothetical protein M9H77_23885 [Catharanthus roseus]